MCDLVIMIDVYCVSRAGFRWNWYIRFVDLNFLGFSVHMQNLDTQDKLSSSDGLHSGYNQTTGTWIKNHDLGPVHYSVDWPVNRWAQYIIYSGIGCGC